MHASFGVEQSVGEPALHDERRGQQAGLLALGHLVELDLEAPSLSPPRVHAQQHLRPVLGVRAAGARVDLGDRVALVVLAREQALQLEGTDARRERADRLGQLALESRVALVVSTGLLHHLCEHLGVAEGRVERVERLEVPRDAAELGRDRPRVIGVVPEPRLGGLVRQGLGPSPPCGDPQVLLGLGQAMAQARECVSGRDLAGPLSPCHGRT